MALYRRYRPQKFQDVIGQEHVTRPLMAALRADRTAHAYLFSGPRGCGKTTSARILARCLNCEQAPTDTPCGRCESCRELSLSGGGSLDVVEMDAASHGGVDDARELIERAAFAPARDRYKIFVIDEAHMVSNQGFNALLKLVEEPPPHVKFVFATTEPEKVIGTIRSRTHHYPFRLVPPETLESFMSGICAEERIEIGAGVLPLVVRAGGGSVRDSLSVLDQLMGGSEGGVLAYEQAIALLGFTDGSLLDDAAEAIAARDGATLFAVVERVVQSGHDPRRFVEDLLQRLRDLIVVSLAGEHAGDVLASVPRDQYERMLAQAEHLGAAGASRAADLTNEALSGMVGATSPRLLLELLCARLLLPQTLERAAQGVGAVDAAGAGDGFAGVGGAGVGVGVAAGSPVGPPVQRPASAQRSATRGPGSGRGGTDAKRGASAVAAFGEPATQAEPTTPDGAAAPGHARGGESGPQRQAASRSQWPASIEPETGIGREGGPAHAGRPAQPGRPPQAGRPAPSGGGPAPDTQVPEGPRSEAPSGGTVEAAMGSGDASIVRQRWKEIVEAVSQTSKSSAALIDGHAMVGSLQDGMLVLQFKTAGLATTFNDRGHGERVAAALHDVLGIDVRVRALVGGGDSPKAPTAHRGAGPQPSAAGSSPVDDARRAPRGPRADAPERGSGGSNGPGNAIAGELRGAGAAVARGEGGRGDGRGSSGRGGSTASNGGNSAPAGGLAGPAGGREASADSGQDGRPAEVVGSPGRAPQDAAGPAPDVVRHASESAGSVPDVARSATPSHTPTALTRTPRDAAGQVVDLADGGPRAGTSCDDPGGEGGGRADGRRGTEAGRGSHDWPTATGGSAEAAQPGGPEPAPLADGAPAVLDIAGVDPAGVLAQLLDAPRAHRAAGTESGADGTPEGEPSATRAEPEHDPVLPPVPEYDPYEPYAAPSPGAPSRPAPGHTSPGSPAGGVSGPSQPPAPSPGLQDRDDVPFYKQRMPMPAPAASDSPPEFGPESAPRADSPPASASPGSGPVRPKRGARSPSVPGPDFEPPFAPSNSASPPRASESIASRILAAHGGEAERRRPPSQAEIADEDEVSLSDPTIEQSNLVGLDVVLLTFDATVIEEIAKNEGGQ
ncbi:MAG: DNA polymerase III subunit gamma and tau [Actinomycetaceae bacterium]|nr:DNA polymerase III subunit gamma and tau [Actinomycetaceae bacterium]